MEKITPEVKQYFCDRCKKEVKNKGDFDSSLSADFVGRDYAGHAVGGNHRDFDLCGPCTLELQTFLTTPLVRGEK